MSNNVPITNGQGQSSVAAEEIGTVKYQQIKVVGGETGSTSVMGVNPDRSINVSVIGTITGNLVGSVTAVTTGSIIAVPTGSVIAVLQSSSIIAVATGSVVAVPVGSTIAVLQSSSILSVPVGSTIAVIQNNSIAGTYSENDIHNVGSSGRGLLPLGVRNDTITSLTNGAFDYTPFMVGMAGEQIVAPAPISVWVQGTADLRTVLGTSVQVLAAGGSSVYTFVTAAQVANMGPASVLVTFAGGLGSILSYTIAPAGGGSNIVFVPAIKTGANSKVTASISGTASVLVSMQGFLGGIGS